MYHLVGGSVEPRILITTNRATLEANPEVC